MKDDDKNNNTTSPSPAPQGLARRRFINSAAMAGLTLGAVACAD
jgi:hypothetical protein